MLIMRYKPLTLTQSPIDVLQANNRRSKVKCTVDVHTIFKRDDNCVNPDTDKIEKGHWCTIFQYVAVFSNLFI